MTELEFEHKPAEFFYENYIGYLHLDWNVSKKINLTYICLYAGMINITAEYQNQLTLNDLSLSI